MTSGGRRGMVVASVMLAAVMQVIDMTIASVALPHIQGSLSATPDQIAWVLTSYLIAAAVMTPPTGRLAGRFGRKRVLLVSVAGFTVASALCGMATSLDQLVIFRVLQGALGAALVPMSQATLLDTFPRERHGSAMAIWGVGMMVGPILGPTLGGYLTDYYSWRWIFYINLPFGLLAFLGILAFVEETETRDRPFNLFGFAMLSLAVGSLQLILDRGQQEDWFASTEIIIEAGLVAAGLWMFVVDTAFSRHPFLDPKLLKDRNFATGLFLVFVFRVILLATTALLPPFLESVRDFPAATTGLVLAPRGVSTMIAMIIVGRLLGRGTDPRPLIVLGLLLLAISLAEMMGFTSAIGPREVIHAGVIQGLGLGFVIVPLTTISFSTLAPWMRTEAAGVFNLLRHLGSSIGISVVFTALARNIQVNHSMLVENVTPYNRLFDGSLVPDVWRPESLAGLAALDAEINRQAATISYVNDFKLLLVVVLLTVPLVLLLRNPRLRGAPAETVAEAG